MTTPDNKGVKHDDDKLRMELIPPEFLTGLAEVLTKGAGKYGDRNWERGMKWSRVYGALQRHLNKFWSGIDTDPEWRLLHLKHASACIAFLTTYQVRGVGEDDRSILIEEEDKKSSNQIEYLTFACLDCGGRAYPDDDGFYKCDKCYGV